MTTDAKLLPCPFCGETPREVYDGGSNEHWVSCESDTCPVCPSVASPDQWHVRECWNTRHQYVHGESSKLSNKEHGYLLRLKDRAETLRARTKSTINTPVVIAAAMELHAVEWAISKLDISPLPHSQEKP